ncbi:MAG: hypothetical protein EOM87_00660, partial [Clostridia bacterium]|nr:hypothetical protein [Clostridia bacterium]
MGNMTIATDATTALTANAFNWTGYTFAGWSIAVDDTVEYADGANYTMGTASSYTLYAVWEAIEYTITYDLDEGINNENNPTIYKITSPRILIVAPIKVGYIFIGWFNADMQTLADIDIEHGSTGNIIYYAVWEANDNTLVFNANGGSGTMTNMTIKPNITAALSVNTYSKTGYSFAGWATASDGEVSYTNGANYTMGTNSSYTLYAIWTINKYRITFNSNGGTAVAGVEQNYATVVVSPSTPFKYNFELAGWYTDLELTNPFMFPTTMPAMDLTLYAEWGTEGLAYVMSDGSYSVNSGTAKNKTEIYIPNRKNGILVTTIAGNSFANCENLQYVEIPISVTLIGPGAFSGCGALSSISLPFVGARASASLGNTSLFGYIFGTASYSGGVCVNQKWSTTAGNQIDYYLPGNLRTVKITGGSSLKYGAFFNCSMLTEIEISPSTLNISSSSFAGCSNLSKLTVPFIGASSSSTGTNAVLGYMFGNTAYTGGISVQQYYSSAKTTTYYIPANLVEVIVTGNTLVSYGAFSNCTMLEKVSLAFNNAGISPYTFYGCTSLYDIELSDSIAQIPEAAFYGCISITAIDIGANIISIDKSAYYGCESLIQLSFENATNLVSIGETAFYGCSAITNIMLPQSLISIGAAAFGGYVSLENISLPFIGASASSTGASALFGYIFGTSIYESAIETVQIYSGNSIIYYLPSKLRTVTITGNNGLKYGAFSGCAMLSGITFSSQAGNIEANAFYGCIRLRIIKLMGTAIPALDSSALPADVYAVIIVPDAVLSTFKSVQAAGWYDHREKIFGESNLTGDYCINNNVLVKYVGNGKDINLPSVTSIGERALYNCSDLTAINISGSVTTIGSYAFAFNQSVESSVLSITFGAESNLVTIASYAFSGCSSLTGITLPSNASTIGNFAFENCRGLLTVSLPANLTQLGESAFYKCSALTNVTLPSGIISIAKNLFKECTALLGVTLSANTEQIRQGAFYGCSSLAGITLPSTVVAIGEYAFFNCSSMTSVIFNTNIITEINGYTFYNCSNIASISLPLSISKIGEYAFYDCIGITNLSIPNNVTAINAHAFKGCSNLVGVVFGSGSKLATLGESAFYGCLRIVEIDLPETLIALGEGAFGGCSGLTTMSLPFIGKGIVAEGTEALLGYIVGATQYTGGTRVTQYYSETQSAEYYIPTFLRIIEITKVTAVGYGAFSNCSMFTSIIMPTILSDIGDYAYYGCSSLTAFLIPANVTSLGKGIFENCTALSTITIPTSVTSIGADCFKNCSALTSLMLPPSVTVIGAGAFSGCSGLTSATLSFAGESAESTNEYALFGHIFGTEPYAGGVSVNQYFSAIDFVVYYIPAQLEAIYITGNSTLNYGVFSNCLMLKTITIPSSVTKICGRAFAGCSGLTSFTINNTVTEIEESAFAGCSGLTTISLPNSMRIVGEKAFESCTLLNTVNVARNVELIAGSAFNYCSALVAVNVNAANVTYMSVNGILFNKTQTAILKYPQGKNSVTYTIPSSVITIGAYAFSACDTLETIIIPTSVTSIGAYAFIYCSGFESINIPSSVLTIAMGAFKNCSNLDNLTIPSSVTGIGEGILSGCNSLGGLTLPFVGASSIATGQNALFGYIFGNVNYEGSSSVTQFYSTNGSRIFYLPDSLIAVTVTGETRISYGAFYNCKKLVSIILPNTVDTIGEKAFMYCEALVSVDIPESVTSIAPWAFSSCTALCSVNIPASVENIGAYAFAYCSSLTLVNIMRSSTNGIASGSNGMFLYCNAAMKVYVRAASLETYEEASVWSDYASALRAMPVVSFETNGGSLIGAVDVAYNGKLVKPESDPSKIGNSFVKWYADMACLSEYNFDGTYLTEDIVVYAKWAIGAYTITFETNGGSGVANITEDYNIDLEAPVNPTKAGFEFAGWYSDAALNLYYVFTDAKMPDENITLYADWGTAGLLYTVIDSDSCSVSKGEGQTLIGAVKLPNRHEGKAVTVIHDFSGSTGITSFVINLTAQKISGNAFSGCSGLLSITIPDNVTEIGAGAFSGCTGLLSMTLTFAGKSAQATGANALLGYIFGTESYVGGMAVSQYYGIENSIAMTQTYYLPSGLVSVTINGAQTLGFGVFSNCANIEEIVIGDTVTGIGERAFWGCSGLSSVTLSANLCGISENAFTDCIGLSVIVIPDSVVAIDAYAFSGCTGLVGITVPSSVLTIGASAFSGCSALTDITIEYGVKEIREGAFGGCGNLTAVVVPDSVESIGNSAFKGCVKLTTISLPFTGATITSTYDQAVFGYIFGTEIYSGASLTRQEFAAGSYAEYYIPNTLLSVTVTCGTELKYGAFSSCSKLTTVILSDTITIIGSKAFAGCSLLANINIPNNAAEIKSSAFYQCAAITSVELSEVLTRIEDYAFYGCAALTGIAIPASVENIGVSAFSNCSVLASLTFGESSVLNTIGANAFKNCSLLTNITLPSGLESIGNSVFSGCGLLSYIGLPFVGASAEAIGENALFGYIFGIDSYIGGSAVIQYYEEALSKAYYIPSGLTTVSISAAIKLGYGAFYDCDTLTNVSLNNGIALIGEKALYGCGNILDIVLPSSVSEIRSKAFDQCGRLRTLRLAGLTPPTIGTEIVPFYAVIFVPNSVLITYKNAEGWKNYGSVETGASSQIYSNSVIAGDYCVSNGEFIKYLGDDQIVTLPSVTSIKSWAFYNCTDIEEVTIGAEVVMIDNGAFYACSGLSKVTFGLDSLLQTIGDSVFYGCGLLTSITLPSNVTDIGKYAFKGCSSLTSIIIPSGITELKEGVFADCSDLISVNIVKKVTSIGKNTFENCGALSAVTFAINSELETVGESAFKGCSALTSITLPEELKSIHSYAFENCRFTALTLPSGVTYIGNGVLKGCSELATLTLPFAGESETAENAAALFGWIFSGEIYSGSVEVEQRYSDIDSAVYYLPSVLLTVNISGNSALRRGAFYGCAALTSVSASNVEIIGAYAFYGCTSLTLVNIPSASVMGAYAFYGCGFVEFTMPGALSAVESNAFGGCVALTEIELPAGVISIGEGAFAGCSAMTTVTLSSGLLTIGVEAFKDCTELSNITVPSSVTSIGSGAFAQCMALTSISLPFVGGSASATGDAALFGYVFGVVNSALPVNLETAIITGGTIIAASAFADCARLTGVSLPNSVTSIGSSLFTNCNKLRIIRVNSIIPPTIGSNSVPSGAYVFVDSSKVTIYKQAAGWYDYRERIYSLNSITEDEKYCVENNVLLKYIGNDAVVNDIPLTVTSIGSRAFYNCGALTSVIIPDGVASIGTYAFANCVNLVTISIPNTVKSIESYAFQSCANLTALDLPDTLETLGAGAMYGCSAITSFDIPTSLTALTAYVLYGCEKVTAINIPANIRSIGAYAFAECDGLTELVIPENVIILDSFIFQGCANLGTITIPSSINILNDYLFSGCTGLTTVNLPVDLIGIGNGAFENCVSLGSIYIPTHVIDIGNDAFSNCIILQEMIVPGSVNRIGEGAFGGCRMLKSISLPFLGNTRSGDGVLMNVFGKVQFDGGIAVPFDAETYYIGENLRTITLLSGDAINARAFYNCSMLDAINLPLSITDVGEYAFYGCSLLKSISLPSSVKYLKNSIFEGCSSLTAITIKNGVLGVGDRAFAGCSGLTSVNIPASVEKMGAEAFSGCSGLISITMPFVGNYYAAAEFEYKGFYIDILCDYDTVIVKEDGETLTSGVDYYILKNKDILLLIDYEEHLEIFVEGRKLNKDTEYLITHQYRYSYDFDNIVSLLELTAEDDIGNYITAMYGTESVSFSYDSETGTLIMGNFEESGLRVFVDFNGKSVFGYIFGSDTYAGGTMVTQQYGENKEVSYCIPVSLRYVTLTGGTFTKYELPYGAFYGCSMLTSIIIPANTYSIDKYTFAYCSNITGLTIPLNITSINEGVFEYCTNLMAINFNEGILLESIGERAFYGCSKLTSITIPKSTTLIAGTAFNRCTSLLAFDVHISNTAFSVNDGILFNFDFTELLRYPEGKSGNDYTVPEVVNTINDSAFYGCKLLTSINIHSQIISIGKGAFSGCAALETITLPFIGKSIDSKTHEALLTHEALFGYIFGEDYYEGGSVVTQFHGKNSYRYYIPSNLRNVVITFGSNIANGAFYNMVMLTSITLPSETTLIGENAFAFCEGLAEFTIPSTVTQLGNWAFSNCTSLIMINIPAATKSIGSFCFYNCTSLSGVVIKNNDFPLTDCNNNTFLDCAEGLRIFINDDFIGVYRTHGYWWQYANILSAKPKVTLHGVGYIIAEYYESITIADLQIKDGYLTTGCYTDLAMTVPFNFDTLIIEDLILYGTFTARQYNVTLNSNGGGGTSSVVVTYDSEMPLDLIAPTRIGYTFVGYFTGVSHGKQYYTDTMASAAPWTEVNVYDLYAHWEANIYTVTLAPNGGEGGTTSVAATYDSNMPTVDELSVAVSAPEREGYTFAGYWDAVIDGNKYYNANMTSHRTWNKAEDTTLYAHWTVNNYTVTFNKAGGSGGDSSASLTYGEAIEQIGIPEKAGYTFVGYYTGAGGAGSRIYDNNGNPVLNIAGYTDSSGNWIHTSNVSLTAFWSVNNNLLHFNANGGSGTMFDMTIATGATLALNPNEFTLAGFTFVGWSCNFQGTTIDYAPGADYTMGTASEYTLFAVWSANVIFDANGGEGTMAAQAIKLYESKYLSYNAFTYDGHTFLGWAESSDGAVVYSDHAIFAMTTGIARTLYAKWS